MYELTWYLNADTPPVSHKLDDITTNALLDAAADLDLPHEWFTATFIYRLLYHVAYQLMTDDEAEVTMDVYGTVVVERV
ncbi:MAG: hypothetical protein KDB26_09660 [Microthrixaceae bacterium]|nr:hypothetical protein [Microthrixaceae bacterium]